MRLDEVKQKTKTATQDDFDISAFRKAAQDDMMGTQDVPAKRKQKTSSPSLKKASAQKTRARASQAEMPPEAAEKMSFIDHLGAEDEISDDEAARRAGYDDSGTVDAPTSKQTTEIATIEDLPAVVSKEMSDRAPVEPEWHQVKNLPGYLKAPIRAIGRQVFGTFTSTAIEDIQVLANVGGGGPNSKMEMNAVAGWLRDEAERWTEGEANFEKTIPDYGADFKIYRTDGYTFMAVKDFAGTYIYAWPSVDNQTFDSTKRAKIGSQ